MKSPHLSGRSLLLGLAILLVVLISGILLTRVLLQAAESHVTWSLTARVITAASSRTWDRAAMLTGPAGDQGKPAFEEVREELRRLLRVNADARYVYLAALRGGKAVILADSGPSGWEAAPRKIQRAERVFASGQAAVEGPYEDRGTVWVSSLAPVRDPRTGAVAAVLGFDIDAGRWASDLAFYRRSGNLLTALAVVATFVFLLCLVRAARARALLSKEIDERRRAEEAVRTSGERLREFVNSAPIGIFRTNMEGYVIEANPALVESFGFESLEQANKLGLLNLYRDPQDRLRLFEAVQKGPVTGFGIEFKRADGQPFPVNIHARLVRDEAGRPQFMEGTVEDVTERRRAEEAQKASEQRLASIVDFLPDAIMVVDGEGKVIAWNQAMETMTGVKAPDMLGKGNYEYAIPFYGERRPILIDYALSPNTPRRPFYRDIRTDDRRLSFETYLTLQGKKVYTAATASALFDHNGKVVGAIEILHDLTQRKQAEEALAASEERYRTLISNMPVGLYRNTAGPEGRMITANPAVAHMFGYDSPEEFMKVRVSDTYVNAAERKAFSDRLLAEGQVAGVEMHLKKRDGTPFWGSVTAKMLPNENGEAKVFDGMIQDITERKHAEEELKLRNALLSTQQEVSIDGILVVDSNGKMISFNQRFVEMWRIPEEVAESRSDEQALQSVLRLLVNPGEFIAKVRHLYENRDETSRDEVALVDGRTFDRYSAPMRGLDGHHYGRVWYFRDITESKRAEEELRKAKVTAEEASRAKGNFLANMSHEIRTPMNAILGFTQLMQRDAALSAEQRQRVNAISRSGEHLLALINDILEMSKIEAGRTSLNPSLFDLHSLLDDIEMMFRVRTDAKHLSFLSTRTEEVPQYVVSDEGKLRQVLINMLGNAVKFTEQGGVALRVRVGGGSNGSLRLVAEVEDTGPGIDEEEQSKVFDQFEQTTTGIRTGGTGLGLAISREFARLLGGDLTFQSQRGIGSVFRLEIAVEERREAAAATKASRRRVAGLAPGQSASRILIVDDKEENRLVLRDMLGVVGFKVREASDGKNALEEFETWQPDLVVMDVRMPVMDGYEATRRIKSTERGRRTPVLAVTASAFDEYREKVFEAGADDFLSKPYRELELFEKIAACLGVSYVYEEEDPTADQKERETPVQLTPASLMSMSREWIEQMKEATVNGDRDRLFELIGQVEIPEASLAQGLRRMVTGFRYDTLLALLQGED